MTHCTPRPPLALAALLLGATLPAQDAASTRPLVEPQLVYGGQEAFDRPLYVDFHDSDPGFAYVVVQPGQVFRVPRDESSSARTTFLDLGDRVYVGDNWEEGLLGFAFAPDYADSGHVFVYYSERTEKTVGDMGSGKQATSTRQSVIARFGTVAGDGGVRRVDPDSELRVMTVFQPFGNHNGGTVVFGPDGMLYIALGDGGSARDPYKNGQDKGTLLGSVLRIDVREATPAKPYRIPDDNPFVAEPGSRGEIFCYGLRNPWRISFDRQTGELWCGDVGQNQVEEVDRLVRGGNYGWNLKEGSQVFRRRATIPDDLIEPIAEYTHRDGLSVTGGYVYRGQAIPALQGWFVYGDFATFRLWAVKEDRDGGSHRVRELGRVPGQLSSFAQEPDGELLVTCFDGRVYRLVPVPAGG